MTSINVDWITYKFPDDFKAIAIDCDKKEITMYHPKYPRNDNGQVGAKVIPYILLVLETTTGNT